MTRPHNFDGGRRVCAECGVPKRSHSYNPQQRAADKPVCNICLAEISRGANGQKAFLRRRDEARKNYCQRWDEESLIKMCAKYLDTCGECYVETDGMPPQCFVEPEPAVSTRLLAINYEMNGGYGVGQSRSSRHGGAE